MQQKAPVFTDIGLCSHVCTSCRCLGIICSNQIDLFCQLDSHVVNRTELHHELYQRARQTFLCLHEFIIIK